MESKYIHLIALIVAVFFSGLYLRGESARKSEIKRELKVIEKRQEEINRLVGEINAVAAEKDSLLNLKIVSARERIRLLNQGDSLARDSIDALNNQISAANNKLNLLAQEINDVPGFFFDDAGLQSAFMDPDVSIAKGVEFDEIQTFVGLPALETPAIAIAPAIPTHLTLANEFAERKVMEDPLGSNRSPDIDQWLSALGLALGLPYCAAFTSFCLTESGDVDLPRTRSGRARDFINNDSFIADFCANSVAMMHDKCQAEVPARVVQRGGVPVKPGALVIWKLNRDPQDWKGHIGFVTDWEGQKGHTVEANTSPPGGDQREGLGVFFKERQLHPFSYFRITHFTTVRLKQDS